MVEIKALSNSVAEVFVYGEIGWETNSSEFVKNLTSLDVEEITVRINSPGGDVYDGLAIMNALRSHPAHVTAVIEGLAASAASFIAVGGADHVVMRPGADLMIHDALVFVDGNAESLMKTIKDLDRVSTSLAEVYAGKAGGEPETWRQAMRDETWFTAQEALDAGLVDAVEDGRPPTENPSNKRRYSFSNNFQGRRKPPPAVFFHTNNQEKNPMSFLDGLAKELGKDTDTVRNALEKFLNEEVEVTATVDVTYPEEVDVIPTGKITVSPTAENLPEGLVFALGDTPDGWDVEIDETTGVVTATAPNAEPNSNVTVTIIVNGSAGEQLAEIPVTINVKAANDEEEKGTDPVADPSVEKVTLDHDTYKDLVARATLGSAAKDAADAKARETEVDKWISEGRINASIRKKAISLMHHDADAARELYGQNPVNTIPRQEVGYGIDDSTTTSETNSLAARADKAGFLNQPNFN